MSIALRHAVEAYSYCHFLQIAYNRGHKGRIEFIKLTGFVAAHSQDPVHNKIIIRRVL